MKRKKNPAKTFISASAARLLTVRIRRKNDSWLILLFLGEIDKIEPITEEG
jgi:hypothetical protein